MTQEINLLISLTAGLLSFLSPCVLPLVPVYISLVGGMTLQDIRNDHYKKSQLVLRALVFVAGFTVVFILMGVFIWGAFRLASGLTTLLNVIAGVVIILLGLNIVFDFLSFLNRERRFTARHKPMTLIGVFAAGMALGAGWSPCVGPLLGGIIALTASAASVAGILNLAAYSLGLGVPFILLALAFIPVSAFLDRIKKHLSTVRIASGVFLIAVGVLILLGQFLSLNVFFQRAGLSLGQASAQSPIAFRILFGAAYLILAALPLAFWLLKKPSPESTGRKKIPVVRLAWAGVMASLGILELTGVLQSALLLSLWFSAGEISLFNG
jgi:cytochrome c-type biogenesis protein